MVGTLMIVMPESNLASRLIVLLATVDYKDPQEDQRTNLCPADCLAVVPVTSEPVSLLVIPGNREKYREIAKGFDR